MWAFAYRERDELVDVRRERDRGIEMGSRDGPVGLDEHQDDQAEAEGVQDVRMVLLPRNAARAATEHQQTRRDELREHLRHGLHMRHLHAYRNK